MGIHATIRDIVPFSATRMRVLKGHLHQIQAAIPQVPFSATRMRVLKEHDEHLCVGHHFHRRGITVEVPLEGLRIGEQICRLGQHIVP